MRFTTHSPLRLLCAALAFILPLAGAAQMKVTSLTVEHMKNPSTVDETAPRLSWVNEARDAKVRGERQTAYRIVVASSKEKLLAGDFDLWDSGKVLSEQSTLVPYGGQRITLGAGLLLEGPDVGRQEEGLSVERDGLLGHGTPESIGLEGAMDFCQPGEGSTALPQDSTASTTASTRPKASSARVS